MNIVFWSDSYVPSIAANSIQVLKMCNALTNSGHEVCLYAKKPHGTPNNLKDINNIYGIDSIFDIKILKSNPDIKHLDYDFKICWKMMKGKPDLIYTRNIRSAIISSILSIPTILELHYLPVTIFSKLALKRLHKSPHCKNIVVISNKLKNVILQKYPYINESEIQVAHDAVDLDRFNFNHNANKITKEVLELNPDNKTAVYVGHLYPGRGIKMILKLAKSLSNINFLIIGGHFNDIKTYQDYAYKNHIDNIKFVGFVPNSQLPHYYALADVLLMPYQKKVEVSGGGDTSEWMSPMKTYEYMATGKPIISSDLPALREVLNESNAILVEPDNVEDWKYHIENTLTNTILATKISFNARMCAESNTWDDRVSKILGHL
jgi:glycosyltransferase involved in cell wall biosynthesis